MKKVLFYAAAVIGLCACGLNQTAKEEIASIDINRDYPEKEISLKEVANVSYIRFDSSLDEYLFQGRIVSITPKTVVIHNFGQGDFHVFSRNGSPKAYFNHMGNGPEEYMQVISAIYDEPQDDLFVISVNRINVYSSQGEYKRMLSIPPSIRIGEIASDDPSSFLVYDMAFLMEAITDSPRQDPITQSPFIRISKQDGRILEEIPVSQDFNVKVSVPLQMNGMTMHMGGLKYHIVDNKEGLLLCNHETDTVFLYGKQKDLRPVFVRTPLFKDMAEPKSFLNAFVEAGSYQFFEKVILKIDASNPKPTSEYYARDQKNGEVYKQKLVLDEYAGKEFLLSPQTIHRLPGGRTGCFLLSVGELKEAYANGKLQGALKELTASLSEEENDVCMLLEFK